MPGWAWGWDAVGAVATSCATIVALGAMPWTEWRARRAVLRDRREASAEIISASTSVVGLHHEMGALLAPQGWDEDAMASIRMRAHQLEISLDRLLSKPGLTVDVIIVAAGGQAVARGIAGTPTLSDATKHSELRPRALDKKHEMLERMGVGMARFVSVKPDIQRAFDANSAIVADIEARIAATQT